MTTKIETLIDRFMWRHACKEFDTSKKIANREFECLLEIARLSPSSFGLQPYEILVLQNQQILEQLHPHLWGAQKQLFSASHFLMFVAKTDVTTDDDYFKHILLDIQQTPKDMLLTRTTLIKDHQEQQIAILKDRRYLSDWAAKQAYIALGNVMSAAAELGIDSCPIEGFVKDKVDAILDHHNVIDLDKQQVAVFCALGYRLSPPARAKTRKQIAELVRYI